MPDYTQHDLDAAREWIADHFEDSLPFALCEDEGAELIESLAALLARHRAPLVGLLREARRGLDEYWVTLPKGADVLARIDAATGGE